jgi:COP9 signalosome complex subunit 3
MSLNNLEEVISASTTTNDYGKLASALRAFMKRDVAESILASTLPNDIDPFTVLNPNENTLGYLYVL